MTETSDATAIFAPIWRRKWLILAVGIIVAAGSYFYYKRQRPTFQATTQLFLGAAAEEQAPGEKTSNKGRSSVVDDQVAVINTIIVERVRAKLRAEGKGTLAHGSKSHAKSPEKSEFITITTEAHSAKGAALVANLTAQTYITRQKVNRERAIEKAISISRRQLKRIEASAVAKEAAKPEAKKGAAGSGESGKATGSKPAGSRSASSVIQEAELSSKINQLESSLGTATAQQVKRANPSNAKKLSPKPRQDAIFGFVLGIVLAAISAYVVTRFDRRLRSLAGVELVTSYPLLAALPKVRRPIVSAGGYPRPSNRLLEPLRRVHTALQLAVSPVPRTARRALRA